MKENKEYIKHLTGFVGFLCSFGGKWFGGYAKNNKGDNYADRGSRMLLKQLPNIVGVKFEHKDYRDIIFNEKCIIYCDPPYEGTTKYKGDFNHTEFWEWCRIKTREGHKLFVSEYNAPEDFECVWKMQVGTKLNRNKEQKRVEKLFIYKNN